MDIENKYGTLERQKYLLPVISDIDKLCRKHGIKYSLSHGSLLGAIRHKGFIPWDDDIDIVFDRENYEKFLHTLTSDMPDGYQVVSDIWVKRIGKIGGDQNGYIDLFVFDNMPDAGLACLLKAFLLKTLQGMMKIRCKVDGFSLPQKVMLVATYALGKLFSKKAKQKLYDRVCKWGNKKETKYKRIYNCTFKHISKIQYDFDVAKDYTEVEFEGHSYMALKKWDHYLTAEYGDYMTPPKEVERIPKHMNVAESLNES